MSTLVDVIQRGASFEEVIDKCKMLTHNGFGIQGPNGGTSTEFNPCVLTGTQRSSDGMSDPAELTEGQLQLIRTASGCQTLQQKDFLGHPYLTVHWKEYALIEAVLTALIQMGQHFSVRCKLGPEFGPSYGDVSFSWSMVMDRIRSRLENALDRGDVRYVLALCDDDRDVVYDLWNWPTEEGKAFCRRLRAIAGMKEQNEEADRDNYYKWERWTNYGQPL